MINLIQSSKNNIFKYAKSLQIKKYRDKSNQYLIEGLKIVNEALSSNVNLRMILFSAEQSENNDIKDILAKVEPLDIQIYRVDNKIFKDIAETESSQGIISIVDKPVYKLNNVLDKKNLRIIVLDEVSDPGNLGTIIRTADACNYDAVLLSKGCVDVYNGKTVRAAMGSLFHLPIIQNIEIKETVELLKKNFVTIYGAHVHKGEACYDIDYDGRFAVIIGNESTGLSKESLDSIENMIRIPMPGHAESLNASVAASIIMYESIRKEK